MVLEDDDAWKHANLIAPFQTPKSGTPPQAGTMVRLAWDLDYFISTLR